LGNGSLQEEVRFATCPELIVARMFSKKMDDNEAVVIENFLQYCKYEGYADTFKCCGLLPDHCIMQTAQTLVAMDALDFSNSGNLHQEQQYQKKHVDRELLKAYAAYSGVSNDFVATGNWGGGCFKVMIFDHKGLALILKIA
jgi:poly(ADP-ribose) glycohydrolase